jgi:hypothetical protein
MSLALFAAGHLLTIPLSGLAAYAAGSLLFGRWEFGSLAEDVAVSAGMGIGLFSTAIFALGLVGGIRPWILVLLLAAALACGRTRTVRLVRSLRERLPGVALFLLPALPVALLALYPPTAFDSTLYHLPLARAYAAAHRLLPMPFVRFSALPQLNEMPAAAALSLTDDIVAQEIQVLVFLLTGVAAVALGARAFSPAGKGLVWAFWLASPLAIAAGTSVQDEAALALFGTLTLLTAGNAVRAGSARWAALAGAFAGFAAGTKYLGLFFVVFGVALFLGNAQRRGWRPLFVFGLCAAAAGIAGYVRTGILTGNPVFPFFETPISRVHGQGYAEVRDFLLSPAGSATLAERLGRAGLLLSGPRLLGAGPLLGYVGPLLVVGWLVLAFLSPAARSVLLAITAALALWCATAENPRFLVPILPAALVLSAEVVSRIARRPWALAAVGVAVLVPVLSDEAGQLASTGLPPSSSTKRERFLSSRFPEFGCYQYLNGLRRPYRLFGFFDENMTYFAEGERIGDWFGPASYSGIRRSTGRELDESLGALGADFVLFPAGLEGPPGDASFRELFGPACRVPAATVYARRSAVRGASALRRVERSGP